MQSLVRVTPVPREGERKSAHPADSVPLMSEPYSVISIPEIDPISVAGVHWKPLRRTLWISAFGINAYTAPAAADHNVEQHPEEMRGQEEAYVVSCGRATFMIDENEVHAPHGTVVFVRAPK